MVELQARNSYFWRKLQLGESGVIKNNDSPLSRWRPVYLMGPRATRFWSSIVWCAVEEVLWSDRSLRGPAMSMCTHVREQEGSRPGPGGSAGRGLALRVRVMLEAPRPRNAPMTTRPRNRVDKRKTFRTFKYRCHRFPCSARAAKPVGPHHHTLKAYDISRRPRL